MKIRKIKKYGWRRDLPDQRDLLFKPKIKKSKIPDKVDLTKLMPPIYDQGQLGSCTANAIAGAIEFELIQQKQDFMPSRLFIYYNERVIEGTVNSDSGAEIRDGIKSVHNQGVCTETLWTYSDNGVAFKKKPNEACYKTAHQDIVSSYMSVDQNLASMKSCLAEGYPFVFGFTVYESFESTTVAKSGVVPMPKSKEQTVGGHAVVCVGFDDAKQVFICRNSWGVSWGKKGYFTIDYAYLTNKNLASDFWTIRVVG